jgi:hypothetical protein
VDPAHQNNIALGIARAELAAVVRAFQIAQCIQHSLSPYANIVGALLAAPRPYTTKP